MKPSINNHKIWQIAPAVLILAVYLVSYIGVGVHECRAEGSKEIISFLGREVAHPHHEQHHDEDCHHDGACHHDGNCCQTSVISISEADNGGGNDTLHNFSHDFTTLLIHNIFDLTSFEIEYNRDIQYSIPLVSQFAKRPMVLRL